MHMKRAMLGIVLLLGSCSADPPVPNAPTSPDPEPTSPQWDTINFVDEFGDITDLGAISEEVKSIRPMSFPYTDTTARIFVDCDRAWIRFSESPNLTGGDTQDGYDEYSISVRVDGNDSQWRVIQSWGDQDIAFVNDSQAISAWSSGSSFTISLPWYGEGYVAFPWSLNQSSEMISKSCD